MALPSDLRDRMSYKDYTALLQRESMIFAEAVKRTGGSYNSKPWEFSPEFLPSTISNSSSDSGKRFKRGPDYKSFVAWDVSPLPLSMKEERDIIKNRRWRKLNYVRLGDYKVAPSRYDLQWIQRIFWTSREIRSVTRFISLNPSVHYINDLRVIRNQLNSLSPGNGLRSDLQRKLFSDVYFCLRQCSRLQDDEESLTETRI